MNTRRGWTEKDTKTNDTIVLIAMMAAVIALLVVKIMGG